MTILGSVIAVSPISPHGLSKWGAIFLSIWSLSTIKCDQQFLWQVKRKFGHTWQNRKCARLNLQTAVALQVKINLVKTKFWSILIIEEKARYYLNCIIFQQTPIQNPSSSMKYTFLDIYISYSRVEKYNY